MDLKFKSRNGSVPPEVEKYAEKKVARLDKLGPRVLELVINFEEHASKNKKQSHRVEILAHVPGTILKSQEDRETFYVALDAAVEKLKVQLLKVKTKQIVSREGPKLSEVVNGNGPAPAASNGPDITTGTYSLRPLSVTDAVKELSEESPLIVFVNEQATVNALFRRGDGGYTLFVPDE
jgi:ribosomal subunit interface protein